MTDYLHKDRFVLGTNSEYASNPCRSITGSCEPSWNPDLEEIKAHITSHAYQHAQEALQKWANEEGFTFDLSVAQVENVELTFRTSTRQYKDYTEIRKYAQARITVYVEFYADRNLAKSPLAITAQYLLVLAIFFMGMYTIKEVFEWINNMTTKHEEWEVYEHEDDPDSPNYCSTWLVEKGERTEPAPLGMMIVLGFLALLMVLFMFVRGKRK